MTFSDKKATKTAKNQPTFGQKLTKKLVYFDLKIN
jgi:hypothetical protein